MKKWYEEKEVKCSLKSTNRKPKNKTNLYRSTDFKDKPRSTQARQKEEEAYNQTIAPSLASGAKKREKS